MRRRLWLGLVPLVAAVVTAAVLIISADDARTQGANKRYVPYVANDAERSATTATSTSTTATSTSTTATSTSTTATSTSTATSSATPAGQVFVRNVSSYSDFGSFWIVGEVVNGTNVTIGNVELRSSAGGSEETGFAILNVIPAGGDSPFQILMSSGGGNATVTVVGYETSGLTAPATGFVVTIGTKTSDQLGGLEIEGTVKNNSSTSYQNVIVAIALYDATGNVARVETAISSPFDLGPGQSGTWTVYFFSVPSGGANAPLRTWVDAEPQ